MQVQDLRPGIAAKAAAVSWSVSPWNLMVQTKFFTRPDARQRSTSRSSRAG